MTELLNELQVLLRLTDSEAMVANARRSQAADDAVRQELAANASDASDRADRLVEVIRDLGGFPDAVGRTLNRIGTATRIQLEQAVPTREALLNDLRLEHELRDRARFARVLAQVSGKASVTELLERIEASHDETIDWIERRLGEVAVGGPAALRPTPTQLAAAWSQRLALLPARTVATGLNRTLNQLSGAQRRTTAVVEGNLERSRILAGAVGYGADAARKTFLGRTEERARRRGESDVADELHEARADLGALDAGELPLADYDELTVAEVTEQLSTLEDPADLRAVLAYEEANRSRKGVITAVQARLDELVGDLVAG